MRPIQAFKLTLPIIPCVLKIVIFSKGKFIETAQCGGYLYGITREAIESVARKGLACALHMEFEVRIVGNIVVIFAQHHLIAAAFQH